MWFVTAGQKMSTVQSLMMLCGWD